MNLFTMFGSVKHRETNASLESGSVCTVFGSAEVDLTQTRLGKDEVLINVITLFGDTRITVPADWGVVSSVVCILGEAEGLNLAPNPGQPALHLKGLTLLGSSRVVLAPITERHSPPQEE